MEIKELRLIPQNTEFWSISNQTSLMSNEDQIVEITATCYGNDVVFVKPKQLLFNLPGFFPTLIGKGKDEWSISYSKTKEYKIPEPEYINFSY